MLIEASSVTAERRHAADDIGNTQSQQDEIERNMVKHVLPSVTTDTEPWSTATDILHECAPADVPDKSVRAARDYANVPTRLRFGLNDVGIAAEPTFSMTSTDVSPDKSSLNGV